MEKLPSISKERMVTTCFADIFDIIGTDTFLGVRKTRVLRLSHDPSKYGLSGAIPALIHKKRWIIVKVRAMRLARFCDLYLQKTLSIWTGFH